MIETKNAAILRIFWKLTAGLAQFLESRMQDEGNLTMKPEMEDTKMYMGYEKKRQTARRAVFRASEIILVIFWLQATYTSVSRAAKNTA